MSWQHLNQPQGWIGVISLSLSGGDPGEVKKLERTYHSTVRAKRRAHRLAQLHDLLGELRSNPRSIWQRLKISHCELPIQLQNVQAWDAYLANIANVHTMRDQPINHPTALPSAAFPIQPPAPIDLRTALDAPISLEEVQVGLQHLHNNRASGKHGLPAELLRYAQGESSPHVLAPVLVDVFNAAFLAGTVPADLNSGLITPVFKKVTSSTLPTIGLLQSQSTHCGCMPAFLMLACYYLQNLLS